MKKYNLTQIIRHLIQAASFLLFPGMFIIALSSISGIYQSLLSGTFSLASQGSSLLTLLAVIPITMLWGRFFCGYLCAFGSMQELTAFAAKKLRIKQLKPSQKTDRILKKVKIAVLILLFAAWTAKISLDSVNPWYVFGVYSSFKGWTSLSTFLSIGGALLFLIIAASLFVERFFCRYLCPLGGIFSIVSIPRFLKIKKNKNTCIDCSLCSVRCPMGIDVNSEGSYRGKVTSGECIDCFRCTAICPASSLCTNPREAISGSLAALAITGIYYAGMIPASAYADESTAAAESAYFDSSAESEPGRYIDGTYYGTGRGFRGDIDVSVTVAGGKISSVSIESCMDDSEFFNRARSTVIGSIISEQSTDVAAVTGATFSSKGIISAVENALSTAGGTAYITKTEEETGACVQTEPASDSNIESSEQESDSENDPAENSVSANFEDGTYTGSGSGRNGSIDVEVSVSGGAITSIEIVSSLEDAPFLSRAISVIDSVISTQSVDVPTVSGATMSSNGILEAVADALDLSFTNTNSQIGGRGHGHGHGHH